MLPSVSPSTRRPLQSGPGPAVKAVFLFFEDNPSSHVFRARITAPPLGIPVSFDREPNIRGFRKVKVGSPSKTGKKIPHPLAYF